MDSLASVEDVALELGRDLTTAEEDRVVGVLAKASMLFRREARREFTAGGATTRLKVEGGRVRLPQSPVTDVTTVVDDDGTEVDFESTEDVQWITVTRSGETLGSHEFVTVTYEYGADIPDEVRIAVAEIAARVLRIPAQAAAGSASTQRSAGGFQETNTYAAWAVGNATTLSPEDKALARSYRYRGTKVIVCQP